MLGSIIAFCFFIWLWFVVSSQKIRELFGKDKLNIDVTTVTCIHYVTIRCHYSIFLA